MLIKNRKNSGLVVLVLICSFMMVSLVGIQVYSYNVAADTNSDSIVVAALAGPLGLAIYLWGESDGLKEAQIANDQIAGQNYMTNTANDTLNVLAKVNNEIKNEQNMFNLSLGYYAAKAVQSAYALYDYQSNNNLSHYYNAGTVLTGSPTINDLNLMLNNNLNTLTTTFSQYPNLSPTFVNTQSSDNWGIAEQIYGGTYGDMNSNYVTNNHQGIQFTSMLTSTGTDLVLMNNGSELIPCGNPVYNNNYNESIVISNSTGVIVWHDYLTGKLTNGQFGSAIYPDLSNGSYSIELTGMNGCLCSDIDNYFTGGMYVLPALVIKENNTITEAYGYKIDASGQQYNNIYTMGLYNTMNTALSGIYPSLNIYLAWASHQTATLYGYKSALINMNVELNLVANATMEYKTLMNTINSFAYSAYTALVSNPHMVRLSPVDLFTDPSQMDGLTAEQIEAIYISYMNELRNEFLNSTALNPQNATISGGSLNLICRGYITTNSNVKIGDNTTVFTPFFNLANVQLTLGSNTINQTGWYLLYNQNCTNLTHFDYNTTMSYKATNSGYKYYIYQMYYKEASVSTVWINQTKTMWINGSGNNSITPLPSGVTGLGGYSTVLYFYIAGVFAIVGIVVWVIGEAENPVLTIVGKILLLVGICIGTYAVCLTLYYALLPTYNNIMHWFNTLGKL